MKICKSPANTSCIYQRIARDQAPDDNAQPGSGTPDAYEALCQFLADRLSPDDMGQAESLLRHFLDTSGDGNLATDEPPPFGRPTPAMDAELRRRSAVREGRARAEQYLFAKRFPGAARIRMV